MTTPRKPRHRGPQAAAIDELVEIYGVSRARIEALVRMPSDKLAQFDRSLTNRPHAGELRGTAGLRYSGDLPIPRVEALGGALDQLTAAYKMPYLTAMSQDRGTRQIQRRAFKSRWAEAVGGLVRAFEIAKVAKVLSDEDLRSYRALFGQIVEQGRLWGYDADAGTRSSGRLSAARRYAGDPDGPPLAPRTWNRVLRYAGDPDGLLVP